MYNTFCCAFGFAAATRRFLPAVPRRWLVTGGGRHNGALMDGCIPASTPNGGGQREIVNSSRPTRSNPNQQPEVAEPQSDVCDVVGLPLRILWLRHQTGQVQGALGPQ